MDNQNLTGQVHNAMYQHLQKKGVVSPVEVLMNLGVLSRKDLEDWRFGRIPYLEKACRVNLKKLSTIMHEIRAYAAKSQLKPSWTLYHQYGGDRKNKLRFCKSDNRQIEDGYATHYVDTKRLKQMLLHHKFLISKAAHPGRGL